MNQSEKTLSNRCTRIEVELEKTDQHNFPEFSFLSLKNELEKATETEGAAETPDGDDCARIAAMLEAKYSNFGNTAKFDKKKRRRHERIEDFIDMGEGYDQEDDFIDDSEAHEIFVPQQYDTWHGGFYVNQGLLRLKMADTADEEVTMTAGTKMRNFGKAVSDSGESDSDKSDDEKSAPDRKDENKIKKIEKLKTDDGKRAGPGRPPKNGDSKGTLAKLVKNGFEAKATPGRPPKSPSKTLPETKIQEQPAQLPEAELPEHIRTKCNTLRQIAEASKGMSSQKFFSASVLDLLVEIDNHIKDVSPKIRNATLEFVSEPMPCKKDTLMLRLKKMRKDKVESVLKEPFDKFTVMIKKCVEIQTVKYEGQLESFNKRLAEYTERSKTDPSMKKPRQPSKNFNWTSDAKSDFFELLKIKESLFSAQKAKDMTLEAWIKEFVNLEIKSLFPPGWVTYEKLEKVISIEKNKREMEKNSSATNGTPKLEKKVGEKRKLVDSPVEQLKSKTTQPAKMAKQKSAAELNVAPVCDSITNSITPVSMSQQSLSVEQQIIAQKVIQLAMEKQRRELEENLAKENETKNKKAQEQRMQKLMKLVANQNSQLTPANKTTKPAAKTPKKSPKELKEQLLKGVSAKSNQLLQKTPQKSPSKSPVNDIASQNSKNFSSSSLPCIYQITSSPVKTVIKSSPVKNTPVFMQQTQSASPKLQSATRRLSSENMLIYPAASRQYISPVTLEQQNHKSPSSSSFSINNLVSQSLKTSQSYILSQSQNNHHQVQNDHKSPKASNIQGNSQQFLVQRQMHQNVIQNPLAAQNQVRIQQTGEQQSAGYRYIETSNGIFLGQLPPNQGLPNDPLSSIEPTLPIDPFFHASRLSGDKAKAENQKRKNSHYFPSHNFY